jgi:hypothetical protein
MTTIEADESAVTTTTTTTTVVQQSQSQQEWTCHHIEVTDDKGTVTDIADYIGTNCPTILKGFRYHLPEQYNDNDSKTRKKVAQAIRVACAKAGFYIVIHKSDSKKNHTNMRFQCNRCRMYQKCTPSSITTTTNNTQPSKSRKKQTQRALCPEDTCHFSFALHYDSELKRYYVKGGNGNATHKGHARKDGIQVKDLILDDDEEEETNANNVLIRTDINWMELVGDKERQDWVQNRHNNAHEMGMASYMQKIIPLTQQSLYAHVACQRLLSEMVREVEAASKQDPDYMAQLGKLPVPVRVSLSENSHDNDIDDTPNNNSNSRSRIHGGSAASAAAAFSQNTPLTVQQLQNRKRPHSNPQTWGNI